jgi:hypothetical protein
MAARSAESDPAFMTKCDDYFEWAYAAFAFVFQDGWRPIDARPKGSDAVSLLVE